MTISPARLRRALIQLAGFFAFAIAAAAQTTVPVSGHAQLPDASASATYSVLFELIGASNCQARVDGVSILSDYHKTFPVNATTGAFSGVLYPNTSIDCNGTLGTTDFLVTPLLNGRPNGVSIPYKVGPGAFLLESATPDVTTPAIVTPSAVVTNPQGAQTITQPGSTFLSVNNLAVTGTCTGCAIGSGYNLIQQAGSNLAQRLTLNFVSGVTCVDNPGASRTDCTVQGGGGSGTVTSVSSGNFSPLFNVNVATPTTTPAFSFAAINQSANQVYAGPSSGVAAAPGFRALVSADIPSNAANTSGNAGTATALAAVPSQCGTNNFATGIAASGNANCAQPAYSGISGTPTLRYQTVQVAGVSQAQEGKLNFPSGMSCSDNPGAGSTDCSPTTGGSGTVTSFSAGNLSPLFTTSVATPTTTPALSFTLSTAAAHSFFGNNTGSTAAPAFSSIGTADLPGAGAVTINTSSPLGGGGSVALGSSLSLTCAGCLTSATAHNLLSATHGDTVAHIPVLGDVIFGNATPAWAALAGQTTTTKKYLSQIGTGTVSAAPSWAQVAFADLSGSATTGQLPAAVVYNNQSNTYTAGTQDFSGSAHTLPALKGLAASKPATCTVGELYFATDATAGQNIYECASTNAWTQQLNSGGGGGLSANQPIMPVGTNSAPVESGSTTSLNPITPTNTANGDLEVMWVGFNSAAPGAITPPAGWSAITNCSASGNGVQINAYSHTASSEGSNTGSIAWANSVGAVAAVTSYRNASIDVCSATTAAAAGSFGVPSLTAAANTDRIVAGVFQGVGSGNIIRATNLPGDLIEQFQSFFAISQVSYPITSTTVATRSFNSSSNPWAGFQLALSFVPGTTAGPQGALTFNQYGATLGSLILSGTCTGTNPVFGPYGTCGIQIPNGVPIVFYAADGHPLGELWTDSTSNFHISATDGQRLQVDSGNLDVGDNSGGVVTRSGNGIAQALGNTYQCTHGTNATCGVATLASGTKLVSTTAICTLATAAGAAGCAVVLTPLSCSACGTLSIGTVSSGNSFVVNSTSGTDASNFYWEIRKIN